VIHIQSKRKPQSLVVPKLFYFCYFAGMAALMPFLALYYQQIGLSARQIGLLSSISPLVLLLAAPLWGALADATQQYRRILLFAISGLLLAVFALSQAHSLLWLLPAIVAYAFFNAPIMPLVDHSVLTLLGERKQEYGRQRVWGAFGWGGMAALAGPIIERWGLAWAFYLCLALMGANLLAGARLIVSPMQLSTPFRRGAQQLLTNWPWLVFLITLFLNGLGMSFTNNFLFLYMNQLQAGESLMGLSLVIATLSEIPVFFFAEHLLARWGARTLLIAALLAQTVRMFAYAAMPVPWLVLPISLLHGLTFSAMWVAAVAYANASAPPGLGATAQGLLSSVSMGLAGMIGALVGGFLYDAVGPAAMFGWAGIGVLAGLIFFSLTNVGGRATQLGKPDAGLHRD